MADTSFSPVVDDEVPLLILVTCGERRSAAAAPQMLDNLGRLTPARSCIMMP
jgi:hypothetical protein